MGSGRSKSRKDSSGSGRRSLLCSSFHSSCFASSSTSHDSDDDNDVKVCNNGTRNQENCYDDKQVKDKSENDKCVVVEEEEEESSRNVVGSVQESSTPGRVFSRFKFNRASSSRYPTIEQDEEEVVTSSESVIIDRIDDSPLLREPSIEPNVRFSRTLSVGRLRDRVLRRTSLSVEDDDDTNVTSTSILNRSASTIRRTLFGGQDHTASSPVLREGRYRGLLEHRSDFIERRRRIRSQVRALQRLGSRIENVAGQHHDRACVVSGQHQAGRCTCRVATNPHGSATTDETNARASISRIVLLAEALFEVLDEIHQQSVVLSSQQPSISSIGSVPAPNDVVDLLPMKLYTKLQSEDSSQCYICLVEYEEGDTIRTLPCHHEFHRICVDKWLKEIHRVCPLCRGDICRRDTSSVQH